jgi:hypothetical protein
MVAHASLTGADLHEPKGVASATSGQVYVANGAGSGVWTTLSNANKVYITARLEDISTAKSVFVVPGVAGDVSKIYSVIDGAIASADCGLSFEIAGTPITSGGITIANSGSAAGDVDSSTPSAANTITAGQAIEIISDGASTNTVNATITLVIDL